MSSDWFSLFVHQGKEFMDSVSRKNKDEETKSVTESTMASDEELARLAEPNMKQQESSTQRTSESETELSSEKPGSSSSKEHLSGGEKYIYEEQLEQLQEQLVDIMIQNQEMETELNNLRNSDVSKLSRELEKEQHKRKQLEVKLEKTRNDDETPKLRRRRKKAKDGSSGNNEGENEAHEQETHKAQIPSQPDLEEPTSQEPPTWYNRTKSWFHGCYISISQRVTLTIWDIISDLSDEETPVDTEDVDGPPLAVKTLKENIKRFGSGIKPISEFFNKTSWVLSWKNPAATMLIFLVYVFSFWHGYTVSLLIFLAIVQLSANFIYNKCGSVSTDEDTESPTESTSSWSDRFQIVLHVARKVQNVLGLLSDHLEKIKNLLMWKVAHVTFKLYIALWVLLIASVILSGPQFFTLGGMFLGYKLFIQNPIYRKFPKLQRRHDTTLRLWNELPIDSEATGGGRNNEVEESQLSTSLIGEPSELSKLNSQLFCERYKLTSDEVFVNGWEEGWRTSLMNKNRPLVNIKHGRLYLTQNYLCFERSRTNLEKNVLLKLSDMRCVNKYKPLFLLPGTGMSIEVCMKDKDEPYIFAAILSRDDAYNDIIQTAKDAGLGWAMSR